MSDQHFLKCNCQSCGESIEFPAHGAGLEIACPHCGQKTLLSDSAAMREASVALTPLSPEDANETLAPPSESGLAPHPVPQLSPSSSGKKSRWLSGALVVLVLLALAGSVWYFLGVRKPEAPVVKSAPTNPVAPSAPAQAVTASAATNPAIKPPVDEPADSSISVAGEQKPAKSIDDLKASSVTLEKAKSGNLIHAIGTIKNMSDQQRFGVRVELELNDAQGHPAGKASDYTQVIEPRKEWRFRALVLDPRGAKAVTGRVSSIKEDN